METAHNPARLGMAGGGKIKCMAEGGLISGLISKLTPKTQAQRYAEHEAAQAAAKPGNSAPAPVAAAPAPGGALNPANALKTREAAAGLAKGGKVPGKSPSDTADNIPIMATAGEFMIKKKAVDKIGVQALDALNAIADKPGGKSAKPKGRGASRKMAQGGYLFNEYRSPRDERPTGAGSQTTQLVAQVAKPVSPAAPVAPMFQSPVPRASQLLANQSNPTSAAMVANGRNPVNPIAPPINAPAYTTSPGAAAPTNAIPYTMPPEPITATTSPGAAPSQPTTVPVARVAPQSAVKFSGDPLYPNSQGAAPARPQTPPAPITGGPTLPGTAPPRPDAVMRGSGFTVTPPPAAPSMAARAMQAVRGAGNPALGAAALIPEQFDVAKVAANPNATGIDVATQQAQGLGRFGAAGAGALTGAAIGAPLGPVGAGVGALAGGAFGYYAADKAIQGGRALAGTDPRAPVDRLATTTPTPAATVAAPGATYPETAGQRTLAPKVSPQSVAESVANPANPAGAVTKIGNSYSGAPGISGDISINGRAPKGGFVSGTGDGTFTYGGTGGGSGGGGGVSDQSLAAARMAAAQRGDVEGLKASYAAQGKDFGPKVNAVDALINNGRPMTTKKAAAIAALQSGQAEQAGRAEQQKLARDKFGLDKQGSELDNKAKARLGALQDKVFNAKTPAEQVAAEDKLRAFQGKYEKTSPEEYAYAPGGQTVDPATGTTVTQPGVIFNKRTGEVRQQQGAKTLATDPRAMEIRDNKAMSREQKVAALKQLGYQ